MSTPNPPTAPPSDPSIAIEAHLGRALTLIHKILPVMDAPDRTDTVQRALQRAADELAAARAAHAELHRMVTESEVVALISAAVAVVLGRPHRVLDVRKTAPAVTWVNAWAIEGRFQHYSSHKVR